MHCFQFCEEVAAAHGGGRDAEIGVTGFAVQLCAERPSRGQYRDHVAADDAVIGGILPDCLGEVCEG